MTFEADFVSQIKGNNHIAGRTRITKIGNKSFHLEQDIIITIFVVSAANIQKIPHTITIRGILYDNLGESVYFQLM